MYKIIIISFILICSGCNNNRNNKVLNKELNILSPKDKVWAHRVNSLNDIKDRVDDFHGIEVDIFYNKTDNNFEVKHDIDSKGINLEIFLDSVLKVKEVLFWFDYKNLNEQPVILPQIHLAYRNTHPYARKRQVHSFRANGVEGPRTHGKKYWAVHLECTNPQNTQDTRLAPNLVHGVWPCF